MPIDVPSLEDRRDDIPELARHFIAEFNREQGLPNRALGQDAATLLQTMRWPGNVRQLENVMERAFALSPGRAQIEVDDLPDELRTRSVATSADAVALGDEGIEFDRLVGDFERELIRRALEKSGGNKRMASDLLHIKRTTLIEKLKRLERM